LSHGRPRRRAALAAPLRPADDGAEAPPLAQAAVVALSTYFVVVWGAGFVASRIALQHAAPFSYIGVRYAIALAVALLAFGLRARRARSVRHSGPVRGARQS